MTSSTISQNGQTTIPSNVREFLHVGPSDKIVYRFEGNPGIPEARHRFDRRPLRQP